MTVRGGAMTALRRAIGARSVAMATGYAAAR